MKLVVCYDTGALGPREIRSAFTSDTKLAFVARGAGMESLSMLSALGDVIADTADSDEVIAQACRRWETDAVVTFAESMLPTTLRLRDLLGLERISEQAIEVLTNKVEQRSFARGLGIPVPTSVEWFPSWGDSIAFDAFPGVVKPAVSWSSRSTHRADTRRDMGWLGESILDAEGQDEQFVVEQEMVGRDVGPVFGDYCSYEVYWKQGPVFTSHTGKFRLAHPFRETGGFVGSIAEPWERTEIEDISETLLSGMEAPTGWYHIEFKLTNSGPRLIEVNGRLGGDIADLLQRSFAINAAAVAAGLVSSLPGGQEFESDGIPYAFTTPFPVEACALKKIAGVDLLTTLPGYSGYSRRIPLARKFPAGVSTRDMDHLRGTAPDLAGLEAMWSQTGEMLEYTFEHEDSVVTASCAQLRAGDALRWMPTNLEQG